MKSKISQTTLKDSKVIRKIGNWTVESFLCKNMYYSRYNLVISNGSTTYYPIIYSDFTVGYDFPFRIPQSVKNYIENNAERIQNILERRRRELPTPKTEFINCVGV